MASKFYVVWAGRETGIFTSWPQTKALVDGFTGARYKSFKTRAEAEAAFAGGKGQPGATTKSKATVSKAKPATQNQAAVSEHPNSDIDIYTDGGCEPNPGEAGSGLALYRNGELAELWYGLYNPNGTNNTAELNALHQALLMAKQYLEQGLSVHIHSDSQYAIKCISLWAYGWKANGWRRKTGEIANLSVIQEAHQLYDSLKEQLKLSHVAAHVGIEGNELADRMSIYTIESKETSFSRYRQPLDVPALLAMRAG
ncbi:ribonuclease H family protein [Shewanella insulae]|uniref:ribonuclease H family protein n=1 Tax=Shewanella insulae TaxID=2681496 RepID=UPI001EFCD3D8|nr:ribonuclease H family protein [Shewanella insulae]MCG9739246.1 ribonuclease H family protein [Shewanella insulae]